MPEISIIVPVYNVEKYLHKCVDSILAQTFKDFELILINDGSPDNCGEICDSYAQMDTRIKVIHKENGGLSDARNAGLDAAEGSYIGFVDSDDFIEKDMYQFLYMNIINENADVSICGANDVYKGKIIGSDNSGLCIAFNSNTTLLEMMLCGKIRMPVWVRLYKKALFNKIRFPIGKYFEDVLITAELFQNVNKAVVNLQPKYNYVHRIDSITKQGNITIISSEIAAYKYNLEIVTKKIPQIIDAALFRMWWVYRVSMEKMYIFSNKQESKKMIKKIQKILRKNTFLILSNKHICLHHKMAYLLLMVNFNIYMYLKNKYETDVRMDIKKAGKD